MSQIIFLHGASSSGKSTLARALQAHLPEPYWHLSIDHLRDGGTLPVARFHSQDLDWKTHRAKVFDGFHRSIAAVASAGNNVILEHILDTPGWLEHLRDLLAGQKVLFVGVHCQLEALKRREKVRGDRKVGSAEQDFHNTHKGLRYDLEVDGDADVSVNCQVITEALNAPTQQSRLFKPS
ncbi:Chloramphenicol 3-O phosphotransferase [Pelagimonas phthalicica]|uniref:Chloramphenicol 3-O phosphotransferase n=1 Tax=Pelagimonas phthalicica TaxID=1037362 RepID=A0A238JEY6_9RHOB|nr:AAA family ATPase [Pelagimonas phthalicica]TDS91669.1 chloramphenicol 3-O phosphotransferase [Pelagimonas phthalicica]SMX28717.1 Chloramphenicol 3-O phosphotransferase [Pelagimonas phthalicica]